MNRHFQSCSDDDCLVCTDWYGEIENTENPQQELTRVQLTFYYNSQTNLHGFIE